MLFKEKSMKDNPKEEGGMLLHSPGNENTSEERKEGGVIHTCMKAPEKLDYMKMF